MSVRDRTTLALFSRAFVYRLGQEVLGREVLGQEVAWQPKKGGGADENGQARQVALGLSKKATEHSICDGKSGEQFD